MLSADDPNWLNFVAASSFRRNVDLVIGIGSRLHMTWRAQPPGLKTIRIDIDPVEMVRLKPDVGIVADASQGILALLKALDRMPRARTRSDEFRELNHKAEVAMGGLQPQMEYLKVLREMLPRDGFLVEEVSQMGFAARLGFPVYEPRQYVTCGYQENLGFGYNTALGVKIAHRDKAVVSISGDGGFLFGAQELATAVQHRIGVVSIVFNNSSYGNVLRDQKQSYDGRYIGSELTNPDFCRLAESFGVTAFRARSPSELRTSLEKALSLDAPALIEVPVEIGSEPSPWPFIRGDALID